MAFSFNQEDMNMNLTRRLFTTGLALSGALGVLGTAAAQGKGKGKGKANHHNCAKLLGDKIKVNGNHVIDRKGPHTVSLDVKDGKIAGMHVKQAPPGSGTPTVMNRFTGIRTT